MGKLQCLEILKLTLLSVSLSKGGSPLQSQVTVGSSNERNDALVCIVIGSWQSNVIGSEDDFRSGCRNVSHHQQSRSQDLFHPYDQILSKYVTPGFEPVTMT